MLLNVCKYLADTGYSLTPILLTKFLNPEVGSLQDRYSEAIASTRTQIECRFGILTSIWRCIKRERKSNYSPIMLYKLIIVCVILNNFKILKG